jgi:hypothetical protein
MKKSIILALLLITNLAFSQQSLVGLEELQVKNAMNDIEFSCNSTINGHGEFLLPFGKSLVYDTTENGVNKYTIITFNKKGTCIQQITLLNQQDYYALYSQYEIEFTKINHTHFVKDGVLYTFHAKPNEDFYSIIEEREQY